MTTKTPEQIAEATHESLPLATTRVALMVAAIESDRAQRTTPLVVLAHRETWTNDEEVEVIDVDHLLGFGSVDDTPEEVAAIVEKLRAHGWDGIADDVEAAEKERAR